MITISSMTIDHVNEVCAIEQRVFSTPWSPADILYEEANPDSRCFVALDVNNRVAGYATMRHIIDEGHINNIAVDKPYQQCGIGSLLVEALIKSAQNYEMIGLTLEVRASNQAAIALYHKHGFKTEGYRKNFYSNPKEDALIMWKYL